MSKAALPENLSPRPARRPQVAPLAPPLASQSLYLLFSGWFLLALFVGEIGLLEEIPGPGPQMVAASLTLLLLATYYFSTSFRAAIDSWDIRALLALHLGRFVGIYFLILGAKGELDSQFATLAGWGDIVIATGALVLLTLPANKSALFSWNTLGLLDILYVVGKATYMRMNNPESLASFTQLPLSFLPTLLVPLIIASHVVIFHRLRRSYRASLQSGSIGELNRVSGQC